MARPRKEGLDYFELDCQSDEKIRLIQAEFGLKGFAIVVKLYQKIYGEHGYYCECDDDRLFLFMAENAVSSDSKNLIDKIIEACIRREIFSEEKFNKYRILTSSRIQQQYLNAASKRELIEMKKEYLLINDVHKYKNISINPVSSVGNPVSSVGNTQRREEKSKEEKRRVKKRKESKAPKSAPDDSCYYADQDLNKAFIDYVDMRKKIKAPMTDRAIELAIKKLNDLSSPNGHMNNELAIEILNQSIMNGWKGLFPVNTKPKKQGYDWGNL